MLLKSYKRKKEAWTDGVAHATLDPDTPGVARMHLLPPKPHLFLDPPSLLIINGTWFLPIGPSWALILREFFKELHIFCINKPELTPEEISKIEKAVVSATQDLYPGTNPETILNDLKEIVTLAVNIATNTDIPEETAMGMSLTQYKRYMTAPHRMDLVVSPMSIQGKRLCPLNCSCCYAENGSVMNIEEPLSTSEWKEIIDKCRIAGIPMLTFTGGEPLTRPDIVELVDYSRWFVTRLNTNAYLLTPELAKSLQQASLDGIQITLYSHNADIHDSLVQKEGAWAKTVEGIENALNAGLSVSINTPLVDKNKDYSDTLNFIQSLGVRCVTCSSLIPTGGAREQISTGKALTSPELKEILKEAVSLVNELHMEISFTSPGWLTADEVSDIGLPSAPVCGACLSNMAVAPNGDVVPCQSWLNGLTLGNILTDDWKKIWNGKKSKFIRKTAALEPKCALREESAL